VEVSREMKKTSWRLRQQRGAVAVEFALIMPVLLLILVGTLEFGRVWSQLQVFQGAAREGARCAAVKATSTCSIQDRINASSGAYKPAKTATVTINGQPAAGGCSNLTRGQDVTVSWAQPLTIDIPFWNDVTIDSTITGVFRCE
jgi:Flp pilus assembly protein TadG